MKLKTGRWKEKDQNLETEKGRGIVWKEIDIEDHSVDRDQGKEMFNQNTRQEITNAQLLQVRNLYALS